MPAQVWDKWLGRKATWRLQRRILPNLRWNQEIWGEAIKQHLSHPVRWLDSGCGWRLLGKDLEPLENELVYRFLNNISIWPVMAMRPILWPASPVCIST